MATAFEKENRTVLTATESDVNDCGDKLVMVDNYFPDKDDSDDAVMVEYTPHHVHQKPLSFSSSVKKVFRGVVSNVGDLASALLVHPQGRSKEKDIQKLMFEDFQHEAEFATTCKKVHDRLVSYSGEGCFNQETYSMMRQAAVVLLKKEITVNVFALCNTGKSTLLNAILGDRFLPTKDITETGLRVTIQHDSMVHEGVCSTKCQHTQPKNDLPAQPMDGPHTQQGGRHAQTGAGPHVRTTHTCPRLEVKCGGERKIVVGVKNIHEKIKEENSKQRKSDEKKEPASVPELLLKVNIPLIAEKAPTGWTISLVDNPGFGESKQCIAQATSESWESSTAYIYLTSKDSVGKLLEAEVFKSFYDKGLLKGNCDRLIIALTKIDTFLSTDDDGSDDDDNVVTLEEVQACICNLIKDGTKGRTELSPSSIYPVSGKWALTSSKLSNSLVALEKNELVSQTEHQNRLKQARKQVKATPMDTFECGQGMMQKSLAKMSPQDLVERLNDASGMNRLKERIAEMLSTSCMRMWAENLYGIYNPLLDRCQCFFDKKQSELATEIQEKEENYLSQSYALADIKYQKKELKAILKKKESTEIWKELADAYKMDIENSDVVKYGIEFCEQSVAALVEKCKKHIDDSSVGLTPTQLEEDIAEFLEKTERELQSRFNTCCCFMSLNKITAEFAESAAVTITQWHGQANVLCYKSSLVPVATCEPQSPKSVFTEALPELGEIKLRVDIPNVKLSFFHAMMEKMKSMIKRLKKKMRSRNSTESGEEASEEFSYREWDESLQKTMDDLSEHLKTECRQYFNIIKPRAIEYFFEQYAQKVKKRLHQFNFEFKSALKFKKEHLDKDEEEVKKLKSELSYCAQLAEYWKMLKTHFEISFEAFVARVKPI